MNKIRDSNRFNIQIVGIFCLSQEYEGGKEGVGMKDVKRKICGLIVVFLVTRFLICEKVWGIN